MQSGGLDEPYNCPFSEKAEFEVKGEEDLKDESIFQTHMSDKFSTNVMEKIT